LFAPNICLSPPRRQRLHPVELLARDIATAQVRVGAGTPAKNTSNPFEFRQIAYGGAAKKSESL
jgi:hypothetical protein